MKLTIKTKDIHDPVLFSEILLLQKKYLKEEKREVGFNDSPNELQQYFRYLDREERKELEVYNIASIDAYFAEWEDDAYIMCGDVSVGAPYKSRDYIWMFNQGGEQSVRWELDMEERMSGNE